MHKNVLNAKYILLITMGFLLISCVPSLAVSNIPLGQMKVFTVDALNLTSVPNNIFIAGIGTTTLNGVVSYNTSTGSIDVLDNTTNNRGTMYIGGLQPCVNCEYVWDIGIDSGSTSDSYISTGQMEIEFKKLASGKLRVISVYKNDTGTRQFTNYFDVPASALVYGNRTQIHVITNETNRSNTVFFDSTLTTTTPYFDYNGRNLPYHFVIEPVITVNADMGKDTYHIFHLYGLTQLINRSTVTIVGNNRYTGFGIDYARPAADTNGTNFIHANGQNGTVWADVNWLDPATLAYQKSLLAHGWELGIHFHDRLASLSNVEANAEIDSDYATITKAFGESPECWCSLQNADNVSHAIYAYQHHGLIWRNGPQGLSVVPSVGNLAFPYWGWWSQMTHAGLVYPAFTHGTDNSTVDSSNYDIDYANFTTWSNTFKSAGIKVVPFGEYYHRNSNCGDATINVVENDPDHVKFNLTTNGYPADVNILLGTSGGYEVHQNGNQISYVSSNDGSINIQNAINGTYQVTDADDINHANASRSETSISGTLSLLVVIALVSVVVLILVLKYRGSK